MYTLIYTLFSTSTKSAKDWTACLSSSPLLQAAEQASSESLQTILIELYQPATILQRYDRCDEKSDIIGGLLFAKHVNS